MIPTSSTQRDCARGKALFTDLYELTMLRAYGDCGMDDDAVFSLFVRQMPEDRNLLIACGLDDVLAEIERFHFSPDDIDYLRSLGMFSVGFLAGLRQFRFTGDVFAMPEGTPFFPDEPILEVAAPIGEGQILETVILNQIGVQTILASKAHRIVAAASGRQVVDFGARRERKASTPRSKAHAPSRSRASADRRCWRLASDMVFRLPEHWRTALWRSLLARPKPSPRWRGSIRARCCSSIPTTVCRA